MIKAILFDCDGTLFDTQEIIYEGIRRTFKKFIPDYKLTQKDLDAFLGPPLKEVFPKYYDGDYQPLINEYRSYTHTLLSMKENIVIYENAHQAIIDLKNKGYKLGIVTSRTDYSCLKMLQLVGLDQYFDCIIGIDQVINVKPDTEPFIKALKALGVDNNSAVMIGDSYGDIKGAHDANIYPIVVEWSHTSYKKLIEVGAKAVLKNYKDLVRMIEEIK